MYIENCCFWYVQNSTKFYQIIGVNKDHFEKKSRKKIKVNNEFQRKILEIAETNYIRNRQPLMQFIKMAKSSFIWRTLANKMCILTFDGISVPLCRSYQFGCRPAWGDRLGKLVKINEAGQPHFDGQAIDSTKQENDSDNNPPQSNNRETNRRIRLDPRDDRPTTHSLSYSFTQAGTSLSKAFLWVLVPTR